MAHFPNHPPGGEGLIWPSHPPVLGDQGQLAERFALAARRVTQRTDSLLATAIYHGGRCTTCHILCSEAWTDPCAAQLPIDRDTARAMLQLQDLGTKLGEVLAGLWPSQEAPARIGIFSEGSIAAFAPTQPDPLAPDWLERLREGRLLFLPLGSFRPPTAQAN